MIMVEVNHTDFYLDIQKASRQPLIMVAPGTGLAPCRSLILDRLELSHDYPVSSVHLFFGGRNEKADYFYENDWKNMKFLLNVVTAFSRDDPTGKKVYVQDRIREHGEMIVKLLFGHKAIIIVCGSSGSMPKAVREAFLDVVEDYHPAKPNRAVANALLTRLEANGRYKQETW
jgi:sulfite reductase alpha subunit-like flavoprotein